MADELHANKAKFVGPGKYANELMALYLGRVLQLVERLPTEHGWSVALGNLSTSLRLAAILRRSRKWFDDVKNRRGKYRAGQHDCARGPCECFTFAQAATDQIQAAIDRARKALRAADDAEIL